MLDLFSSVFLLRGPIRKSGAWHSAAGVVCLVSSNGVPGPPSAASSSVLLRFLLQFGVIIFIAVARSPSLVVVQLRLFSVASFMDLFVRFDWSSSPVFLDRIHRLLGRFCFPFRSSFVFREACPSSVCLHVLSWFGVIFFMHCASPAASMLRGFLLRFWLVFFAGFAWPHISLVFDVRYQISCAFFLGFVVDFCCSSPSVLFLIFHGSSSSSLSILPVLLYRLCSLSLRIQNLTSCFCKPSYSVSPGAFEDVHGLSAACATPPTP
jgi:hypothetical protein